jgi:hypothetical protein
MAGRSIRCTRSDDSSQPAGDAAARCGPRLLEAKPRHRPQPRICAKLGLDDERKKSPSPRPLWGGRADRERRCPSRVMIATLTRPRSAWADFDLKSWSDFGLWRGLRGASARLPQSARFQLFALPGRAATDGRELAEEGHGAASADPHDTPSEAPTARLAEVMLSNRQKSRRCHFGKIHPPKRCAGVRLMSVTAANHCNRSG